MERKIEVEETVAPQFIATLFAGAFALESHIKSATKMKLICFPFVFSSFSICFVEQSLA